MSESEVWIVGTYRVFPETRDAVRASLSEHEARTRTEPGCLHASVSEDAEDELALYSIQRWTDQAALDTHRALPHVRSLSAGASERLDGPFTLTVMTPTGEH
jgi:quinol monooxygenase YgiN